ncbi:Inositol polyphosphate 5-phosphatase, putative [Hondaea fermentalgiana]|uniref:Inositol polyphosphate 5-phosphatase, putative n=1 Tax=Hondaea fermentalgiana TaxID=2315210 RepID=A0A2R5G399_9STRA|nr:Inositol polyphosphate 5-phosphatase, putative [Hondaea fermentalgiana]|eukprot:GBG24218.1 Inositol polyphosphate 5-phosphatase, putative [Hondaea fermentalgiana]
MGNSVGDEEPLRKLIPRDHFDVYAIGTQECERTIAKSAVITRKKGWEQTLARFFGEGYAMLRSHTLQATHLIVFVRKELLPVLSNVGSAAVATGYKDTFGNKGGVGVSFNLGRTSFLFIASHFEAHQNRVKQRNDHFHRIDGLLALPPGVRLKPLLQRTSSPTRGKKKPNKAHQGKATGSVHDSIRERASFDSSSRKAKSTGGVDKDDENDDEDNQLEDEDDDAFNDGDENDDDDDDDDYPTGMDKAKLCIDEDVGPSGYDFNPESDPRGRATARFDRVFWFGDFNYRIDASREKVEGLLSSDSRLAHGSLLANDQLKKEKAAGRVFRNFVEGPVNFKPTYKFDKDSDVYDTSKKQRVPAWTDRILHKSTRPHTIEILHYASEPSIRMSDHRPVAAMYSVAVDGIDDPTLIGVESHEVGKAESQVCLIS